MKKTNRSIPIFGATLMSNFCAGTMCAECLFACDVHGKCGASQTVR